METKTISQKNTKKEIWEAYQAILEEIKNKKIQSGVGASVQPSLELVKDKEILTKVADLNMEAINNNIAGLKTGIINLLNKVSDRLVEELKKLEAVNQAVEIKNKQLRDFYKLETEAIDLQDLIFAKEQKRLEFQEELESEQERVETEKERRQNELTREQEEYQYQLKFNRKKDQDEIEFGRQIKEREFNEKLLVREKEIRQKELAIKEQETEIQNLKNYVKTLPEEIEKAKKEAGSQVKLEMEKQFKTEKDLLILEREREKDISKLRIIGLEETTKKQAVQIQALQSELAIANQKAQELAVKIIESGRQKGEEREHYDSQEKSE